MKIKGLRPKYIERDSKGRFKKIPLERRYEKSAFAISRAIRENGFRKEPLDFLNIAITDNLHILDEMLRNLTND